MALQDMDPEKALKTGEKWGKTLASAIFGVKDVLRDGKNMKAAANAKMLQDNAKIAAQNAVTRAKNEAYLKQKQEEAFMKMSHSEREIFKKQQKEARIAASVKKANDDEIISVGHILLIIGLIVVLVGGVWAGAVMLHR